MKTLDKLREILEGQELTLVNESFQLYARRSHHEDELSKIGEQIAEVEAKKQEIGDQLVDIYLQQGYPQVVIKKSLSTVTQPENINTGRHCFIDVEIWGWNNKSVLINTTRLHECDATDLYELLNLDTENIAEIPIKLNKYAFINDGQIFIFHNVLMCIKDGNIVLTSIREEKGKFVRIVVQVSPVKKQEEQLLFLSHNIFPSAITARSDSQTLLVGDVRKIMFILPFAGGGKPIECTARVETVEKVNDEWEYFLRFTAIEPQYSEIIRQYCS